MPFDPTIELTLAENWIEPLRPWSIPGELMILDDADTLAFATGWSQLREQHGVERSLPFSDKVTSWIGDTLRAYDGAAFLRTGFGMFKECPFAYAPVGTVDEAMSLLRWPDTRIGRYANIRLNEGDTVSLLIRPWVEIAPWQEHRVFVDDGQIVGVCPSFPGKPAPASAPDLQTRSSAIAQLIAEMSIGVPLSSYVADVLVLPNGLARLIELNPFMSSTDGILFSWSGADMDGTFRTAPLTQGLS